MENSNLSSDAELFAKVSERRDFFQSVLQNDDFDDWELVEQLGKLLIQSEPESGLTGHVLLMRARRHMGDLQGALGELKLCQSRLSGRELKAWESELLRPVLLQEEQLLSLAGGPDDAPHADDS